MKIQTNCTRCAFLTHGSCIFNKDIYQYDKLHHTDGLCFIKRSNKWMKDKLFLDSNELSEVILQETKDGFAACISIVNYNKEDLVNTLESIKNTEKFSYLVLGIFSNEKKDIVETMELVQLYNIPWRVEHIQNKEINNHDSICHYLCGNLQHFWFLDIESGQTLDKVKFLQAYDTIVDLGNKNPVFYIDNLLLMSTHVFQTLDGNIGINIKEKLKEFDNEKELCIHI